MGKVSHKVCYRCKEDKPIFEFNRKGNGDRFHSYCKACFAKYEKKWRAKNQDKLSLRHKANNLEKYDLTIREYYDLHEEQKGCCAICGIHQTKLKQDLSVDHDHKTGKVRGLLCKKCNSAIGLLCDSTELCELALQYLQKNSIERKNKNEQ